MIKTLSFSDDIIPTEFALRQRVLQVPCCASANRRYGMLSRTERRTDASFKIIASAYLGASCLFTYAIAFLTERQAFQNIQVLQSEQESKAVTSQLQSHSMWYGSQITIPEFHITLSRIEPCYAVMFFSVVLLASAATAALAARFWSNHPRLLVIPAGLFVVTAMGVSYVNPAKTGIIISAVCYSFLFFFARGVREFNVHWELTLDNRPLSEPKFTAIQKLFNQYILTAVAAVAFIIAACIFNASTLIKDALWTQGPVESNKLYRALQLPFLLSTVAYGIWGCFWLSVLVIRDLHIKQHELLLMPVEPRRRSDEAVPGHMPPK